MEPTVTCAPTADLLTGKKAIPWWPCEMKSTPGTLCLPKDGWLYGYLSPRTLFYEVTIWFYWMFYDHFSARSLLAKLGRWGWWWWGWLERKARRHSIHQKYYIKIRPEAPGVWTKDLHTYVLHPKLLHHWECGLRRVQVRQASSTYGGVKCPRRRPPTTGS